MAYEAQHTYGIAATPPAPPPPGGGGVQRRRSRTKGVLEVGCSTGALVWSERKMHLMRKQYDGRYKAGCRRDNSATRIQGRSSVKNSSSFFRKHPMSIDALGDVAQGMFAHIGGHGEEDIGEHQFFVDAVAHGLMRPTDVFTIFLPFGYTSIDDHGDEFEEFFNRHTVSGTVHVGNDGVQQVTTLSKLVIAVYSTASGSFAVAGMELKPDFINRPFQNCIVHAFNGTTLASLRPLGDDIASMRIMYLSGESIQMRFEESGLEDHTNERTFTLLAQFSLKDCTVISDVQKTPWQGNGTVCRFTVPEVAAKTNAALWIYLYDNTKRHSIITMRWSWYLLLIPNVDMQPNPKVTHIVPKKAQVNAELCILGENFSSTDLRVSIGVSNAIIFSSSPNIIRCFVPQPAVSQPAQPVWVANGNVYTRYDCFTYLP